MKITIYTIIALFLLVSGNKAAAQHLENREKFGNTINAGIGITYYGYIRHSIPMLNVNYEFDVARNFTMAPFVSYYSYHYKHLGSSPENEYKYYDYYATIIPVGFKSTYYFDELINATKRWDLYAAGSIGYSFANAHWDATYNGEKHIYRTKGPLFLDLHLGGEFHINDRVGVFIDMASGSSSIGLAIHTSK